MILLHYSLFHSIHVTKSLNIHVYVQPADGAILEHPAGTPCLMHYLQSPLSTHTIHTTNYVHPGKISDFNESQLNEYKSTSLYITLCKIFQKKNFK